MNENKVTIKNKKIMIHKFSRYLLTLVALLAMTTGAWAEEESESFTTTATQTTYTGEHFTITCQNAGDGDGINIGQGKTFTITSKGNENITRVTLHYSQNSDAA